MKILHLASFNRWTGAAAPAFSEVDALRRAGVDAHYGYVGGSTLEEKIGSLPFAHAILRRDQAPWAVASAVRRLRRAVAEGGYSIVHAHLAHDHWLARAALRRMRGVALVRTFHAKRTVRTDPFSRWLVNGTDGICVNNAALASHELIAARNPLFTPPPIDETILRPGPDARDAYGVARATPLLGFIGKVDRGRGFEDAIETLALLRGRGSDARLLIVGRGHHRAALEELSAKLGVDRAVLWAGYHEDDDLAAHFRTPDLMLFTARVSDEGHLAILEAMACGTHVAAYPIYGV
ncbi:MAG TPA: glycosyltransferase family 4 protein, partial [Thermoanaerobaculia bacterium]|nr:glycosyltransferase family 4 protein [Thermoanaerobaculia bacterium]